MAQANAPIDDKGKFINERVMRCKETLSMCPRQKWTTWMFRQSSSFQLLRA